jgi:hypothetical protein
MPSDGLIALCTSEDTVTRALERNPTAGPFKVGEELFKKGHGSSVRRTRGHGDYTPEELDRTAKCGKFPYRPSDLFLKVRASV